MENILFEMRDRLSRSKVVETELAKPLLDALLRVAQGSRRAGPEHSDALAEKVGPRTAVLPGHCPQQQPREVGAAVGGGGRTHGPALSGSGVLSVQDGQGLRRALSREKQDRRATWLTFFPSSLGLTENYSRYDKSV